MSDLLAARSQMAMSLAFHILFAVVGMAMPLLMVLAEGLWLRTRDPGWLTLAKRWSKGTAVLFAVGAVSGTVLPKSRQNPEPELIPVSVATGASTCSWVEASTKPRGTAIGSLTLPSCNRSNRNMPTDRSGCRRV